MQHREWLMMACGPEAVRRDIEREQQQRAALARFLAGHTKTVRPDGVTIYTRKPGYVAPPRTSILDGERAA